jgi:GDP-fucose protein O-fucosyltransferase
MPAAGIPVLKIFFDAMNKAKRKSRMKYAVASLSGGLGNQKLQLFGAVLLAKMYNAPLVEPRWRDWDWQNSRRQQSSRFSSLYDFSHFSKLAKEVFNVDVICRDELRKLIAGGQVKRSDLIFVNARQSWAVWVWIEREMLKQNCVYDFLLRFLNSLMLTESNRHLVDTVVGLLNQNVPDNAWCAIHMRTEKDWFEYSRWKRTQVDLKMEEEVYVQPCVIRDKYYATFVNGNSRARQQTLFLACDENSQHEDPFDIWDQNINVLHKKDILELRHCDNKTKSAVDFEICVKSPVLAGTSRSSFLRLAAMTRFAKNRDVTTRNGPDELPTFIYNLKSPKMAKLADNGLHYDAAQCVQKVVSIQESDQAIIIRALARHMWWQEWATRGRKLAKKALGKCGLLPMVRKLRFS